MTNPVYLSTQGGDFNTNYTSKEEIVLNELDTTKSVTWNFHIDESQGTHRDDMILGRDR